MAETGAASGVADSGGALYLRQMRILAGFLISGVCLAAVNTARADGTIEVRMSSETGAGYSFGEYLPVGYDTEADDVFHPLIVMFHGRGERLSAAQGDDPAAVRSRALVMGPLRVIDRSRTSMAALLAEDPIVITPVCVDGSADAGGCWTAANLQALGAYLTSHYRVDWRRVYATGPSLGGWGVRHFGFFHTPSVAAVVPVCTSRTWGTVDVPAFTDVPMWFFHNRGDSAQTSNTTWNSLATMGASYVSGVARPDSTFVQMGTMPQTTILDVGAGAFTWSTGVLAEGDSPLRATFFEGTSHDAWTPTYDQTVMWEWLYRQQRPIPDGLPADTVFVDAVHPGVTQEGEWTRSRATPGFFFWDYATAPLATGTPSVTFPLRAASEGLYEVYVRHVSATGATEDAELVVTHLGGEETIARDLSSDGGRFVSLGRFPLGTAGGSVTLRGATGATGNLVADAIAIVRRGPLPTPDAGVVASDAGAPITLDAGAAADGGGIVADASGTLDARGSSPDTGGGGMGESGSGGCHAGTGSRSTPWAGAGLALALVGLTRRRRAQR